MYRAKFTLEISGRSVCRNLEQGAITEGPDENTTRRNSRGCTCIVT